MVWVVRLNPRAGPGGRGYPPRTAPDGRADAPHHKAVPRHPFLLGGPAEKSATACFAPYSRSCAGGTVSVPAARGCRRDWAEIPWSLRAITPADTSGTMRASPFAAIGPGRVPASPRPSEPSSPASSGRPPARGTIQTWMRVPATASPQPAGAPALLLPARIPTFSTSCVLEPPKRRGGIPPSVRCFCGGIA